MTDQSHAAIRRTPQEIRATGAAWVTETELAWLCDRANDYEFDVNVPLAELREELGRAAFVAEHLHQMIGRETWRASGGDDGQGHYEGDYRAEQVQRDIERWKEIARA